MVFGLLGSSIAQLNISTGYSPQQLVQNILLGAGVTVSNVTYSGSSNSIGYFSGGGSTNLGLASGVVMSTGNVDGNPFPLGSDVANFESTDLSGSGDNDLEALLNNVNTSYDATILQFDFVPLADTIKFRYVFASEEYPEYVCSNYNDDFGFFLSGPGITGPYSNNSVNIARIPGTALPVAINSVNNGSPGGFNSASDCISLSFSSAYVDNEANHGTTIVFDGFTVVLYAWYLVQPCQHYHIKLAIGDMGDGIYDSAVFLEQGSFSSSSVSVAAATTNTTLATDSTAIEGCTQNVLTFTRSGSLANPLTVQLNISGSAQNGIDYLAIPSSLTFNAGQSTKTLIINPIFDGIAEGVEDAIISIPQTTACTSFEPKVTIHIFDPTPLSINVMNDTSIVCPATFNIAANASGGNGSLAYQWGNGLGTGSSIQVNPTTTTSYYITVTDACGLQQVSDTVTISIPQYSPLQVFTSTGPTICAGDQADLSAHATGGIGNYTFLWSNGLGSNDSVTIHPLQTTTYIISVTDSCGMVQTGNVTVTVLPVQADFTYTYITNNQVDFTDLSLNGSQFHWDFGDGSSSILENPSHNYADTGVYVVTLSIINDVGCVSTVQHPVEVYPPYHLYVPNAFTPDDDGLNDYFMPVAVGVLKSEMFIFNRWGGIIFQSNERNAAWNGRDSNGDKVQLGVYVYLLKYSTPIGQHYTSYGTVTLLR